MSGTLRPDSEQALAEAVRAAAAAKTALRISGGGTRSAIGRIVDAATELSTAAHSGVTLYEPGSLTVVAKAGTPLGALEAALEAEGQHLAFEPMDHRALLGSNGEPTVGGMVAANVSGPRRIAAGACRDHLLGVRFVDGRGRILKSGGRVMKNVTGLDLPKLLCGSYGTLGVISEVALKVLPNPEATGVLLIEGLSDARAIAALSTALTSPYQVTGAAHLPVGVDGAPVTMIRLEGLESSVAYRVGRLKEALAAFGDIAVETDSSRTAAGWSYVRDAMAVADGEGAVWRISVKPTDGPGLAARLRDRIDVLGAFYDWGGGLVWLKTPEAGDGGEAAIRDEVAKLGGHATLIRGSTDLRERISPFAPETPALARLSAGLRAEFDPAGVLNPGLMGG